MRKTRRASVAQRRGSVVNVAAPRLAKRIELQKIFNQLVENGQDFIDRRQFIISILNTTELIGLFTQEQLNELNNNNNNEIKINWNEILQFIQKTENNDNNNNTNNNDHNNNNTNNNNNNTNKSSFTEEMPPFYPGELVEKQSKALEIEFDHTGLKVSMMDTDDIRVVMSSSNKLIVDSMVDAVDLVTDYATRNQLPDTYVPILLDHVERAAIKASQQEIRMLEQMSTECMNQLEDMADVLLSMELQMMISMDDCKRAQFIAGTATSGRRGSVQQDVRMALQTLNGGSSSSSSSNNNNNKFGSSKVPLDVPTPGELAKKLSELQHRVKKKEEELGHYQKVQFHRRTANEESILGVSFESSSKVDKGREEWRKEIDSRLAMIRVTNNERAVLIRDNKTLRTTVECGRTSGMTEKLRERIASERHQRQVQIGELENEVARLEAELRIALEEDAAKANEKSN